MTNLLRQKLWLRGYHSLLVSKMSAAQKRREAAAIGRKILALPAVKKARVVGVYMSLPHEVDTSALIREFRKAGKIVAAPVVHPEKKALSFHESSGPRRKNVYRIGEPDPARTPRVADADLDVILVPGRAFTPAGDRLGTGAGYYDRFLVRRRGLIKIGLAYEAQLARVLPAEKHDVRMNMIVTAARVFRP